MLRFSTWVMAFGLLGAATASLPAPAAGRGLPEHGEVALLSATSTGTPSAELPAFRSSPLRAARKLAEAHLTRVRRLQSSGTGGVLAPPVEALSLGMGPESPLQLLPSPACVQDHLDRCTRSPRPPPQV